MTEMCVNCKYFESEPVLAGKGIAQEVYRCRICNEDELDCKDYEEEGIVWTADKLTPPCATEHQ